MAIKVNGTTVIDDSRNISNVGGLKTVGGSSILGSGDISVGGGAPNYNSTRTSGYTQNSTFPVGATVLADGADSKLAATGGAYISLSNGAQYGKTYTMTGGSSSTADDFLYCRGSNSSGSGTGAVDIKSGTWRIMNAHNAQGNSSIICLRVS